MPRLTVMMPAFNAQKTILSAVESTLRAMPRDSQMLVLDDKSSDGTLDVLGGIRDKRLTVHESPENLGGGAARNQLLSISDSEYVASMDADDICLPWRFQFQLRALERSDLAFGPAVRFSERLRIKRPAAPIRLSPPEFRNALLFHNPAFHPSLAAKRAAIEAVGGYRPLRVAQDYDLWLRIAETGAKIVRLGSPVIAYRSSDGQVSQGSDYAARVRASSELRESYLTLFRSLTGHDIDNLSHERALRLLSSRIPEFRMLNRLHYARIIERDRILIPLPRERSALH